MNWLSKEAMTFTVSMGLFFASVSACRTTQNKSMANLSESLGTSLQWTAKSKVYDFSVICPTPELAWSSYATGRGYSSTTEARKAYISDVLSGSTLVKNINGKDSGVVVDEGRRMIYEKTFPSCGNQLGIILRYSVDFIPGAVAYEIFIKKIETNEIIGLAFNADGEELTEVPTELAFDKNESKGTGEFNSKTNFDFDEYNKHPRVFAREGCFSCHPTVSLEIDGYDEFWEGAKPVAFFKSEISNLATQEIVSKIMSAGRDGDIFESLLNSASGPEVANEVLLQIAQQQGGEASSLHNEINFTSGDDLVRMVSASPNETTGKVVCIIDRGQMGDTKGFNLAYGISFRDNSSDAVAKIKSQGYSLLESQGIVGYEFSKVPFGDLRNGEALFRKRLSGGKYIFLSLTTDNANATLFHRDGVYSRLSGHSHNFKMIITDKRNPSFLDKKKEELLSFPFLSECYR